MLRALAKVEDALAFVSAATLFLVMFLVAADALGRHLLNAPIAIQYELTQNYLLVVATALAFAWGMREGAFIRVTFLRDVMPDALGRALDGLSYLLGAMVFGAAAWLSAVDTWHIWQNDEVIMGVIDWPVAPARVWVPIGVGLLAIRLLVTAALAFSGRLRVREQDEAGPRLAPALGKD